MIPDGVIRASGSLLAHLAGPAGRAIALGCFAAILLGALRVRRVTLRLLAWTTVLYGAIAIAVAGWLLPGMPLRVPGAAVAERIVEANHVVASAVATLEAYVSVAKTGAVEAEGAKEAKEANANPSKDGARLCATDVTLSHTRRESKAALYRPSATLRANRTPQTAYVEHLETENRDAGITRAGQALPLRKAKTEPPIDAGRGTSQTSKADSSSSARGGFLGMTTQDAPWAVIAAGIYAAMALLLLARLLLGMFLSRRLARLAEPIKDADAVRKLRFRAYASGLESVPRLAESELVSVPATLSVFRPLILLPAHWREWDDGKFDAILAHEVSHVARRDSLTQRVSLIHRAIFWFSPLAWWLDRKLNELAEEASDEAALGAGADKKRYAETLLGFFADLQAASGRVWWQGVSMASDGSRAGHAEKRVERILAWGGNISMKKPLAVALVGFAVPVIFLAAAVHPVVAYGQAAQDKTQSDSKNVVTRGGPKAPALPNAPKGGVTAAGPVAPPIAAAPQGEVSAQIPQAPLAGDLGAPPLPPPPAAPAPGEGINNPGPMPAAPQGGVVTPAMPAPPAPALAPAGQIERIRVASDDEAKMLVRFVAPVDSPVAQAARIHGVVVLDAVIAKDGSMKGLRYITGPPLLMRSAMDAVRQWKYRPFVLNGNPVEVETTISVDFPEGETRHSGMGEFGASMPPPPPPPPVTLTMPQAGESSDVRGAAAAVREARKQVEEAERAMPRDEEAIRAAQEAMREAEQALAGARKAMREAQDQDNSTTITNGMFNIGSGPRYVMMSGNSNEVNMSGDEEDLQHARELRKKISGDFIWFERDEKSYIITDPNFIAKAKALFAPEDALAKQQDELGRQQDALGRQQDALGEKMESVKVKINDITPELEQVRARLKELAATGATQRELGELQSRLGALQSQIGRSQSEAGVSQSEIGRQQGELGRKQGELGRQQGELGRQQAALAKRASQQLREMFDDAIAKGIAKPE